MFLLGCPDIDKYVDPRAYILLPLHNPEKCLKIIADAILNDEYSQRLRYIRNEKWRIMNGWSIFPTIKQFIDKRLPDLDNVIYVYNPSSHDSFEKWVNVTKKLVGKPYRRIERLEDAPSEVVLLNDTEV
jgi:hypothetical protein